MTSKIIHAEGRNSHIVTIRPQHRQRPSARELRDRPYPYNLPHADWYRKGKIITRDTMREKCYRAERAVRAQTEVSIGEKFENIAECARFIRSMMETKWFQRRWPRFSECRVVYLPRSSRCWAWTSEEHDSIAYAGRIQMSRRGMLERGELVLLHELAHCVCPRAERHNRLWARTFVDMVSFKISKELGQLLKEEFRNHNVLVNPPRKVQVSAEQLERLAAARSG